MNRKALTLQESTVWKLPLRHNYVKLPERSSAIVKMSMDISGNKI